MLTDVLLDFGAMLLCVAFAVWSGGSLIFLIGPLAR